MPRSSVMGSNFEVPGEWRWVLMSPPSRWLTTSVVRFSALTLLTPATDAKRPSRIGLPLHAELEILVRIDSLCIDRELCHF